MTELGRPIPSHEATFSSLAQVVKIAPEAAPTGCPLPFLHAAMLSEADVLDLCRGEGEGNLLGESAAAGVGLETRRRRLGCSHRPLIEQPFPCPHRRRTRISAITTSSRSAKSRHVSQSRLRTTTALRRSASRAGSRARLAPEFGTCPSFATHCRSQTGSCYQIEGVGFRVRRLWVRDLGATKRHRMPVHCGATYSHLPTAELMKEPACAFVYFDFRRPRSLLASTWALLAAFLRRW
jgi:hypothetical protein